MEEQLLELKKEIKGMGHELSDVQRQLIPLLVDMVKKQDEMKDKLNSVSSEMSKINLVLSPSMINHNTSLVERVDNLEEWQKETQVLSKASDKEKKNIWELLGITGGWATAIAALIELFIHSSKK